MKSKLARNDRWVYIGASPEQAKGAVYTVISVSAGTVHAVSDALDKGETENVAGYSYCGPISEFTREFKRA